MNGKTVLYTEGSGKASEMYQTIRIRTGFLKLYTYEVDTDHPSPL